MNRGLRQVEGFTLVELLVCLALLSVMTLYALNALSSLKDINRVVERSQAQMEVDAAQRYLHDAISDIRPVFLANDRNQQHLSFVGTANTLTFVGAANRNRETGGLYLLSYGVNAQNEFVVDRAMLREGGTAASTKVILLRGVKGVAFKYMACPGTTGANTVAETWQGIDQLPCSIAISLAFPENDPRRWRTEVVGIATAR